MVTGLSLDVDVEGAKQWIHELLLARSDELICHYTKAATASIVLQNGTLRLGQIRWTNDPWETRQRRFEGSDFPGQWSPSDADKPPAAFDRRFCEHVRVLCATRDAFRKGSRIVERGFGRPRMWAQYGGNHTGACLVFDRSQLEAALTQEVGTSAPTFFGDVDYDPVSMSAGLASLDVEYDQYTALGEALYWEQHIERFREALFFRKHEDWQAESEWRFVLIDRESRSADVYPRFGNALKGVILGCNVEESDLSVIAQASPAPVLRLRLSDTDFLLNHLGPPASLRDVLGELE